MTDLKPCPLCGADMLPESDGYEHPADDTCPLDSLYIEARHVAAWNTRAAIEAPVQEPDETAALRAKLAEVERERDAEKRVSDALYERLSVVAQEKQGAIADRDEERKLADDLARAFRATLEAIGPDAVRSNALDTHAARRKE